MVAEPHVAGTEFGELMLAIWKEQFTASRTGPLLLPEDPLQSYIRQNFGIDSRRTPRPGHRLEHGYPVGALPATVFLGAVGGSGGR